MAPRLCVVPQGSVLGPLLFFVHMLPLGSIIQRYGMSYCNAHNTQFYFPICLDKKSSTENALNCFVDIRFWLADNFLQLNESKTEVLIFGSLKSSLPGLVDQLGPLSINVQDHVRSIGVVLDSSLLLKICCFFNEFSFSLSWTLYLPLTHNFTMQDNLKFNTQRSFEKSLTLGMSNNNSDAGLSKHY